MKNQKNRYKAEYIKRVYNSSESLRNIYLDTIKVQHAIKYYHNLEWKEYNPTHFMYVYFLFNTLYSIDWKESLTNGNIKPYQKSQKLYETTKYNNMINFCFEDPNFYIAFRPRFIKLITSLLKEEEIKEIIETISPDEGPIKNINNYNIRNFRKSLKDLLSYERMFKQSTIKEIISFIYQIRNNIFHGTKTLQDMLNVEHQRKLYLYSHFIIATNQMLFSYLDYLNMPNCNDSYKNLLEILSNRNTRLSFTNINTEFEIFGDENDI